MVLPSATLVQIKKLLTSNPSLKAWYCNDQQQRHLDKADDKSILRTKVLIVLWAYPENVVQLRDYHHGATERGVNFFKPSVALCPVALEVQNQPVGWGHEFFHNILDISPFISPMRIESLQQTIKDSMNQTLQFGNRLKFTSVH